MELPSLILQLKMKLKSARDYSLKAKSSMDIQLTLMNSLVLEKLQNFMMFWTNQKMFGLSMKSVQNPWAIISSK